MLHLRKFDLQAALCATRALAENIENQIGAIDHAHTDVLFDIANLDRRQRVIEHDQVGIVGAHCGGYFFKLATAGKTRRIGFGALADNRFGHAGPSSVDELHRFGKPFVEESIVKIEAHQNRLAAGRLI